MHIQSEALQHQRDKIPVIAVVTEALQHQRDKNYCNYCSNTGVQLPIKIGQTISSSKL